MSSNEIVTSFEEDDSLLSRPIQHYVGLSVYFLWQFGQNRNICSP